MLLEGACCGYGASGRNGGFCVSTSLVDWRQTEPARREKDLEVSFYGLDHIKRMVSEHGVDCDFDVHGMLEAAVDEEQAKDRE